MARSFAQVIARPAIIGFILSNCSSVKARISRVRMRSDTVSPKVGQGKVWAFSEFHNVLDDRSCGNQIPYSVQSEMDASSTQEILFFFVASFERSN